MKKLVGVEQQTFYTEEKCEGKYASRTPTIDLLNSKKQLKEDSCCLQVNVLRS